MTQEIRYVCDICGRDIDKGRVDFNIIEMEPSRPRIAPSRCDATDHSFHPDCAAPILRYIRGRLTA